MFRAGRHMPAVACFAAAVAGCAARGAPDETRGLPVIPAVANAEARTGQFQVRSGTLLVVSADPRAEHIARYLRDLAARTTGVQLAIAPAGGSVPLRGIIALELDATLPAAHPEAYELAILPERAEIRAREPRGLFYGAVTLWQLLTASLAAEGSAVLPAVRIRDEPRFAWRGFMLDSARHYMPPAFVKQLIDWMALHKLNVFHWHLTDDQGWRLEIRKYPRLTQVGAWRIPAGAAAAGGRYGGYYTQEEVRDIVEYAAERFVTVVPEIEMPGHAQAAIAAYPQLGTEGEPPAVSADWGVHDYLYNVDEDTFAFLEGVLTEVMALFPSRYIHVGGDEAVKHRWNASPRVQQRMRELGIADAAALQSWFIARIERFLSGSGRKLIGWDEILEGGLPPQAAVMSWRGTEGAIAAARQGHDVVMAPVPKLYLDYLQSDGPDEPSGRPAFIPLSEVYAFEPVPPELDAGQSRHILGAQLNAWTEHMRTPARVQHNAFPRVAALAEVLWTPSERRDWHGFLQRLPAQFDRYAKLGIAHADSAFAVRFVMEQSSPSTARVSLSSQAETGEIRYTLDGSEPGAQSPLYRAPIEVKMPAALRAATFVAARQVAAPRSRTLDRVSLMQRTDEELRSCSGKLVLRLEDDAPLEGERAIFNVDIMEPCWIFPAAQLAGVSRIAAAVGQLPFNFQIGEDVKKIPLPPPQTAQGELEVRVDGCAGERIAVLPLAPAASHSGVTELPAMPVTRRDGRHDLCFFFTRGALEPMWVIDSVRLLE